MVVMTPEKGVEAMEKLSNCCARQRLQEAARLLPRLLENQAAEHSQRLPSDSYRIPVAGGEIEVAGNPPRIIIRCFDGDATVIITIEGEDNHSIPPRNKNKNS